MDCTDVAQILKQLTQLVHMLILLKKKIEDDTTNEA